MFSSSQVMVYPGWGVPGAGGIIIRLHGLGVGLHVDLGGLQSAVSQERLDGCDRRTGGEQVVGKGVAQAVAGQVHLSLRAVMHQAHVDGGGRQTVELVGQEDEIAPGRRALGQVAAQGVLCLEREVHRALAGALAAHHQARGRLVQVQVSQQQAGDFADAQPTAQHEDEYGFVAGVIDHGKEGTQVVFLHRAGQALRLAQEVAAGDDRANQCRVFVCQVSEERQDSCQAAVDRGGLEAVRNLDVDKVVDVAVGDHGRRAVANYSSELPEIVCIVSPGARLGIAAAHPVDEVIDLG
jgi:hypothetical protein